MAEAKPAHEQKRQLLLDAAVRVFARKGYHACRVGDIAQEAGVAYGLLYHYFGSKEEVLETIFRQTWTGMLEAIRDVEELGEAAGVQLRKIVAIVLRAWQRDPDLIRVLVREITRSPHLQQEVAEIGLAFDALERVVRRGQESDEFRRDVEPRLAATIIYGALEQVLTVWVLGRPPDTDEEASVAERTVASVLLDGLAAQRADGSG